MRARLITCADIALLLLVLLLPPPSSRATGPKTVLLPGTEPRAYPGVCELHFHAEQADGAAANAGPARNLAARQHAAAAAPEELGPLSGQRQPNSCGANRGGVCVLWKGTSGLEGKWGRMGRLCCVHLPVCVCELLRYAATRSRVRPKVACAAVWRGGGCSLPCIGGRTVSAAPAPPTHRIDAQATDVAARGLDIPAVAQVVHYHVPLTVEQFVHRSGRTARAQRDGLCLTLVSPAEQVRLSAVGASRAVCWGGGGG
jgi:hypothetical protein